jgi:hypothetical protein
MQIDPETETIDLPYLKCALAAVCVLGRFQFPRRFDVGAEYFDVSSDGSGSIVTRIDPLSGLFVYLLRHQKAEVKKD